MLKMHHCGGLLKEFMTGCVHTPFLARPADLLTCHFLLFIGRVFIFIFLGSIYVRRERPAGDVELMEELADGQTDGGDQ